MEDRKVTRQEAVALLKEYTASDMLLKHAFAVEGVMRFCGRKHHEDEEVWGIVGLIHDLDYEQFPKEHCKKTAEILRQRNWPEAYIRAAVSHGYGICSDIEPLSLMEKTLFAIDELTGLVAATALVRPSRSVMDLEVKSVKKKWGVKAFAAGANREVIERGAAMLGVSVDDLIADTISGMRDVAPFIGL